MSWFSADEDKIDRKLKRAVRPAVLETYHTTSKVLPAYRFVDLNRAIEDVTRSDPKRQEIDSQNPEDLNSLVHGKAQAWMSRKLTRSGRTAWPTGAGQEDFLPGDRFLVCQLGQQTQKIITRLSYDALGERAVLEVAAPSAAAAEELIQTIVRRADEGSIYRGELIELSFQAGTKDEYGDVEKSERLRVLFKEIEPVGDDDLVIDPETKEILVRNVVDLHVRRDLLKKHGVPVRRGVLLYGPPGTGKTFACRYLCGQLTGTTRILVAGSALLQVGQIFGLARLLQPSVVFLEDVDLVFMAREVNLYSSVLGELLDQMDGLRPYEDIGFVMTTNAIDRMESAVKDRPGRISQCIHMGAPNAQLRRRYLERYLRRYTAEGLDLDSLVRESDGATQAFLKEWVHRTAQIASERLSSMDDPLMLVTEDFRGALREMRRFSEGSKARIVGFQTP